jgi:hypothetical protein
LIEIGIAGTDPPDPVFAHENSRMRIVEQVAGEMRQLRNELSCDIGVSLGRDENGEAWRGEQRHDELPRRWRAPRPSHDPGVCCYAHKLVKDAPRGVPGIGSHALALEPVTAGAVKLGIGISGVHQYIGIDSEQLATFHGLVKCVAVGNIHQCAPAAERWQGGDWAAFSLRAEQQPQRGLDQFGHRAALTCRFALELRHDSVVDVEGGLHKEIHTTDMGIWLEGKALGVPFRRLRYQCCFAPKPRIDLLPRIANRFRIFEHARIGHEAKESEHARPR